MSVTFINNNDLSKIQVQLHDLQQQQPTRPYSLSL